MPVDNIKDEVKSRLRSPILASFYIAFITCHYQPFLAVLKAEGYETANKIIGDYITTKGMLLIILYPLLATVMISIFIIALDFLYHQVNSRLSSFYINLYKKNNEGADEFKRIKNDNNIMAKRLQTINEILLDSCQNSKTAGHFIMHKANNGYDNDDSSLFLSLLKKGFDSKGLYKDEALMHMSYGAISQAGFNTTLNYGA